MRDRFHSDPVIEAAELLLQEKAPRDIPIAMIKPEAAERVKAEVAEVSPDTRVVLNPLRSLRATNVMSNGHYSVMVTATGSGYSKWDDLAVTRWQPDPTEDRLGTYLFISDAETGEWWSATAEPSRRPTKRSRRCFATTRRLSSNRSAPCARRSNASSFRRAMAKAAASSSPTTVPPTARST